jgi:hypothetical protein
MSGIDSKGVEQVSALIEQVRNAGLTEAADMFNGVAANHRCLQVGAAVP